MNVFDARAKDFDTEARVERSGLFADEIRKNIDGGGIGLEFGCGTGLVGMRLLDVFEKLIFVDSSAGMIEQVKRKLVDMGRAADAAVCADLAVDNAGVMADCIFMSLVLHHIKDTRGILRRLREVLNERGQLLVIDIDADDGSFHAESPGFDGHNGFEQSELIELAKEVGYSGVRAETFYRGVKTVDGIEKEYSYFILNAVK